MISDVRLWLPRLIQTLSRWQVIKVPSLEIGTQMLSFSLSTYSTNFIIILILTLPNGLQKARGPQPALGPARPDGLKPGPSLSGRARFWAGQAAGLILGPTGRPAPLKKNYKNKKY